MILRKFCIYLHGRSQRCNRYTLYISVIESSDECLAGLRLDFGMRERHIDVEKNGFSRHGSFRIVISAGNRRSEEKRHATAYIE